MVVRVPATRPLVNLARKVILKRPKRSRRRCRRHVKVVTSPAKLSTVGWPWKECCCWGVLFENDRMRWSREYGQTGVIDQDRSNIDATKATAVYLPLPCYGQVFMLTLSRLVFWVDGRNVFVQPDDTGDWNE